MNEVLYANLLYENPARTLNWRRRIDNRWMKPFAWFSEGIRVFPKLSNVTQKIRPDSMHSHYVPVGGFDFDNHAAVIEFHQEVNSSASASRQPDGALAIHCPPVAVDPA